MGSLSSAKNLAPKLASGAILLELAFFYLADEHSRYKILLATNAVAIGATLLILSMFRMFGAGFLRRFVIGYAGVLFVEVLLTIFSTRRPDYLIIDNPNDFAAAVALNGRALGTLPPRAYAEVAAAPGDYHLTATDDGRQVEDAHFILRRPGLIARIAVVYDIGGLARYGAVTFDYLNQSRPRIVPLEPQGDTHLVPIYGSFDGGEPELDRSFARSIRVGKSDSPRRTHLCHLHGASHGCEDGANKAHKIKL